MWQDFNYACRTSTVIGMLTGNLVLIQDGAEGSGEQATSSARTDATAALKPFLHEHAAHFWHELRSALYSHMHLMQPQYTTDVACDVQPEHVYGLVPCLSSGTTELPHPF